MSVAAETWPPEGSPNGLPSLFPLSLRQRVRVRGMSASSANPTAGLTQQSLTNRLSLLRFISTPSSHVSICSLKIAKRQSISRGSVMAAISDTAKVNSTPHTAPQNGGAHFLVANQRCRRTKATCHASCLRKSRASLPLPLISGVMVPADSNVCVCSRLFSAFLK